MSLLPSRSLLVRLGWVGLCVGLGGCGHPVQNKLEGRWVGDSVENFDDQHVAVATGWAKGASFEFSGSTLTVAIPAEDPRSASYKIQKNVLVAAKPDLTEGCWDRFGG